MLSEYNQKRQLIVVFGAPGSGKTELSKVLARELRCMRIEKDFISDILRANDLDAPGHRGMAYAMIENVIRGALRDAGRIIVEAPLMAQMSLGPEDRFKHPEYFHGLATDPELNVELKLIQVWCSEDVLYRRLLTRNEARDQDKLTKDGFQKFLKREPIRISDKNAIKKYDIKEINSETSIDYMLVEALDHVRSQRIDRSRWQQAWKFSFGFKEPLKEGKSGSKSIVLWTFAIIFFLHRFIAPIQWIKLVLRGRFLPSADEDIPASLAELFSILPMLALAVNLFWLANNNVIFPIPFLLIESYLALRSIDIIISNLYYLMLRPIVEINPPHNNYRSFILGWIALLDLLLTLTSMWYFAGLRDPKFAGSLSAAEIFGALTKGDIGVPKLGLAYVLLDVYCKICYGVMVTVVLGRAVSLVPPLPSAGQVQSPISRRRD
jgi:AAA domain